ncbi:MULTISPECIES: glycosyltransferase family 4 protein [unclassified Wenzhouxiangella]|uniref:glycosyltransferase family 4 protein n=1 Tax=unclassified Wenzhouxiangella TaxID=2613841 RepID=UPI000E325385|nr:MULTISPECIES: glycosyltransferase family 4 protein [unclassified Wenzhouxiangella]RFF27873.1 glycosyltransferase [Wenzhouxiangella sp. 15181]RFP69000.1 glycosyltransferase [Wenzhouxiangella sp. 15190]
MRVANVIEEGKLGGPQVRMVRVAKALSGLVTTLIVMPNANAGRFQGMCEGFGVRYCKLPLTRITKECRAAIAFVLFSPIEVARLARLFRQEGIDLVHASGGSWQYKAVIAARLAGVPAVWHLNDTAMPGWVRRLFRLVQPLASGFIFASHRSQEYYGDAIGTERPRAVIPATVDSAEFDPGQSYPSDPDLPVSDTAPIIGTVANVSPIKGLETLIRAAASLRDRGHEPHVLIVGPVYDRQRGYHRRLIALVRELDLERVSFVGARTDVRPLLARLDVYVCSSQAESSPVSVWEAMAMGRPVVSTDVGDVPRQLVDGENGFVVPVGDHDGLAKRIGTLLEDARLRHRFGERAREVAIENFSVDQVAKDTADFYKQVLTDWQLRRDRSTRRKRSMDE